jgi:hypothetical protein
VLNPQESCEIMIVARHGRFGAFYYYPLCFNEA